MSQGSARILATSTKIICTAMQLDPGDSTPANMVSIPIFKKKQRGE